MKKFVVLLAVLAIICGCNPTPSNPPTSTIPADGEFVPSDLLVKAINTGCAVSDFTLTVNNYWFIVKPFLPANIAGPAVLGINTLVMGLKAYNSAVIAWYDGKKDPTNGQQLQDDLLKLKADLMPIIQQILALIPQKPEASGDAVLATKQMEKTISEKGIFSCTFDQFKAKAAQVQALQPIS